MSSMGASWKRVRPTLNDLRTYPEPFVTVGQLSKYWLISRKQLYKQIDAGTLNALRLGPRLLRIRTSDALDFEIAARMTPSVDTLASRASEPRRLAAAAQR
jgi:hypothetical protein